MQEDSEVVMKFQLSEKNCFYMEEGALPGVLKIARRVCEDFALVFAGQPECCASLSALTEFPVLFGTLGHSELLKQYEEKGMFNRQTIEGKREVYSISVVEHPVKKDRQALLIAGKYDKYVYEIMKALGKNTAPTKAEAAFITRWVKELCMGEDVIYAACERTVLATDKHRFEYADKILENWHKAGVRRAADIQSLDESYRKTKPVRQVSTNKFNQFQQNDYDFNALEKELLSN